jgi:ergothioneine biosynthesis protein EgtB
MSVSDISIVVPAQGASSLVERYAAIRRTTETITEGLTAEDMMVQSMSDASPVKWHLAHTSWFFETFILKPNLPQYQLFHKDFTFLFNSYYKQVGSHPNRAFRSLFSRPTLQQVLEFRRYVDRHMLRLLADTADGNIASLAETGLHHEQQHQELIITDIKHGLWSNPLRPAWRKLLAASSHKPSPLEWLDFDENLYSIGFSDDGFSFDNETPRHQVFLNRFRLASRLVTNGDYLQFMRDGGYARPELWLSDGWDTVNVQQWRAPLYWEEEKNGQWLSYTCSGLLPLELDEPVSHVSYFEADAYARWAGARLPTEAEWEVAASSQTIAGNFLESGRFHPAASHSSQFFGDLWEWTSSPYTAYPGFRPAPGALGEYNGKFMCNQMVLRGGSCATPQSHIRATYRNFFPPHARWQFMGLRLAK